MKIGILKEGKNPPDKRVPFSPEQCSQILKSYPNISMFIQPSDNRCFSDLEYLKCGVNLEEDLSNCDVLMGVKEVPIDMLIKEIYPYIFLSIIFVFISFLLILGIFILLLRNKILIPRKG